jgi:putative transposase
VVRACRSVGLSKSAYYEPPIDWVSRDRELIEALRSLADSHPRRGFWKYYKMLRRAGRAWNHKRLYRVYCEMKLNHRRRAKQRVPIREPQPLWVPDRPNVVWSADFMSDALYHGRRFRTFNVLDDHNREAVAIEIDTSLTAPRIIRVFEQLKSWRGLPDVLRVDTARRRWLTSSSTGRRATP